MTLEHFECLKLTIQQSLTNSYIESVRILTKVYIQSSTQENILIFNLFNYQKEGLKMKFYWPAPLDLIDPSYNFIKEVGDFGTARHQNQKYPHELFETPVYHGFLISKIYIDQGKGCRWNASQLSRFLREGARRFLKLPTNPQFDIMGDSGAFTRGSNSLFEKHLSDECLEVIRFYSTIGVDYGLSPDLIIGGYLRTAEPQKEKRIPELWLHQWERTVALADTFWKMCKKKGIHWKPMGVAQGWDPNSYLKSVKYLEAIGYEYIALGGLNRLQSEDILSVLNYCGLYKAPNTSFHLLGVSRLECLKAFEHFGVVSFDSATPIRQAINDDQNNYHGSYNNYLAIRIPQTDRSPKIQQLIIKGELIETELKIIEQESIKALRDYDCGKVGLYNLLDILKWGIRYRKEKDFSYQYEKTLIDKPWKLCKCPICKEMGIEVIIMRNRERNLRRGFHNLYMLSENLKKEFPSSWNLNTQITMSKQNHLSIPALAFKQGGGRLLFTFAIEGTQLKEFAAVSRITRKDNNDILGYQRPEVSAHIANITNYLASTEPILPNSIVVAFTEKVEFIPNLGEKGKSVQIGTLKIPCDPGLEEQYKPAWIVDGQQRTAALKEAGIKDFYVSVVGFITQMEPREQFMLVNSTKPLPKTLLYELLPHTNCQLTPTFEKRRFPAILLERLNNKGTSPFYKRIKTATNPKGIIQDNSILKMLENSLADGALYFLKESTQWTNKKELEEKVLTTLNNFWQAVSIVFSSAWNLAPTKSRLTHGAGIVALGAIMDAIVDRNISNEPLPTGIFQADLEKLAPVCRWTYGHWEFGPGAQRKWNGIQNTPTDIRTLSHYLLLQYKSLVWNDAIRYS